MKYTAKILHAFLSGSTLASCLTRLIFLDSMTVILLRKSTNYQAHYCLFFSFVYLKKSRDRVGCIVTRLKTGQSWVHILAGTGDFSLLRNAQDCSGAHPDPCSVGGYRLGREIDHSLVVPTSAMSGDRPFLPLTP